MRRRGYPLSEDRNFETNNTLCLIIPRTASVDGTDWRIVRSVETYYTSSVGPKRAIGRVAGYFVILFLVLCV